MLPQFYILDFCYVRKAIGGTSSPVKPMLKDMAYASIVRSNMMRTGVAIQELLVLVLQLLIMFLLIPTTTSGRIYPAIIASSFGYVLMWLETINSGCLSY